MTHDFLILLLLEHDATFIEEKGPGSLGTSFQLLKHPGWYMCHDFDSDVGLRAKKERANAKNFVASCMFKPISKKEFFIHGPGAPANAVHTHKAVVLKQTSTINDELTTNENGRSTLLLSHLPFTCFREPLGPSDHL